MKPIINKLKIIKNKRVMNPDRHFVYKFEWYNANELVYSEMRLIQSDDMNLPEENYNIQEMVEHKNFCCATIDYNTMIFEEIEV